VRARIRAGIRTNAGLVLLAVGFSLAAPPVAADEAPRSHQASELWTYGREQDRAIEIAPGIFVAHGNSNAYLIATPEGSVLIDTGGGSDASH